MLELSACATNGESVTTGSLARIIRQIPKHITGEAAATRTYESDKGAITNPEHPQRVVVAVGDYVNDMLAIGVNP
ncbi:hypothetical protein [Paenibacillus sp. NPDC055715]